MVGSSRTSSKTMSIITAFGCPFSGEVPMDHVVAIARACAAVAPDEIGLADTIGCADPRRVTTMIAKVREAAPNCAIRLHLHNTRNTGLANAYAAVEAGVDCLDASTGGIGGCPFAPGATGNIPMEDVVYMLDRMGVDTGVDVARVMANAQWVEERLGKPLPAMLGKAGVFPAIARGTA